MTTRTCGYQKEPESARWYVSDMPSAARDAMHELMRDGSTIKPAFGGIAVTLLLALSVHGIGGAAARHLISTSSEHNAHRTGGGVPLKGIQADRGRDLPQGLVIGRTSGLGGGPEADQIEAAIRRGVKRLRLMQRHDGTWNTRLTFDDLYSAYTVIALNYLNVPGVQSDHELLVKRYISKMHPGGGFSITPGDPPSKGASAIMQLALLTTRDRGVSEQYRALIDDAVSRTEHFLTQGKTHPEVENLLLSAPARLLWDIVRPRKSETTAASPLLVSFNNNVLAAGFPKMLGFTVVDYFQPVLTLLAAPENHRYSRLNGKLDGFEEMGFTRTSEKRILEAQDADGAWWYSTMMTAMNAIALKKNGRSVDDPVLKRAVAYLLASRTHSGGTLREDHNDSSLWDTVLMVRRIEHATGKRLENFDSLVLPHVVAGGLDDGSYSFSMGGRVPDNDDTAAVLSMLTESVGSVSRATRAKVVAKIRTTTSYLLTQRNWDGGFGTWGGNVASFHRETSPDAFSSVFRDDSSPGITARVLQALYAAQRSGVLDVDMSEKVAVALKEGREYLRDVAAENGTWWSRWMVGRLAAFHCVPVLMRVLGVNPGDPVLKRGRKFLLGHQNSDGGWGEGVDADRDMRSAGRGPSTAVQTAWALAGLIAVSDADDIRVRRSLERGVAYILSHGHEDNWSSERPLYTLYSGLSYYEAPEWDNAAVIAALRMYEDYRRIGPAAAAERLVLGGGASPVLRPKGRFAARTASR